MLKVSVSFDPKLESVEDAFKRANLNKILKEIIQEIAFGVERYAKQVTPVDTGRLRSSIGVKGSSGLDISSIISTNTNYARFVHDGTSRMRARPFMKWGSEFAIRKFSGDNISWRLDQDLRRQLSRL